MRSSDTNVRSDNHSEIPCLAPKGNHTVKLKKLGVSKGEALCARRVTRENNGIAGPWHEQYEKKQCLFVLTSERSGINIHTYFENNETGETK